MNAYFPTGRRELPFVVTAAVSVLAGLAVRLVLTETPFWLDEAQTAAVIDGPFGQIDDRLRQDGHPPLYYWLLNGWVRVAGYGDAAIRSLSVVFGIVAVALIGAVAHRIGGRRMTLAALALAATSPFLVRYSTEARMYSLVTALAAAWWLAGDVALRRPRPPVLVAVAASTAALVLTHYWSIFLVAGGALVLAWRWRSRPAERGAVARVAVAGAVGCAMFAVWLPSFLDQLRHTGTPWAVNRNVASAIVAGLVDVAGGRRAGHALALFGALVVLLVVGLLGDSRGGRSVELTLSVQRAVRPLGALVALTVLAGLAATALTSGAFASRYLAVVVGFVIVLAARGLDQVEHAGARAGLLAGCCVLGMLGSLDQVRHDRSQGRAAAAAVEVGDAAGDLVVACPDQVGPATARYVADGVEVLAYPTLGPAGRVDWTDYAERNESADPAAIADALVARAADRDVWVVWQSGYRTFGDQCERLLAELAARRGPPVGVVAADPDLFEPMHLVRFPAAPS